ncbi:hypothetical protein [Halobacillus naozhouensis]|uniref:Uncharacterized protein n=1 Tax=Halobacillus naozhouensis TaxID=554880 RepID=A0ABY8IUL4_9BACI|nr:hypothetical protein [Halobacillus naozhouensis]WFT73630.1 hypothetical protein P9989_14790 [Halobacillus naozhouensis]
MKKYKIHIWIGFILIILFMYADALLNGSTYSDTIWNHLTKAGIFLGASIIYIPPIIRKFRKKREVNSIELH